MFSKLQTLAAALAVTLSVGAVQAETYTAYTASLPPYTIDPEAEMPGISHELLTEMAARADVDIEIEYLPWKRAQATVQKTPNSLLFTATRSVAREALYSWIVEMAAPAEAFVSLGEPVNSYEDGSSLDRIAVLGGSPRERRLLDNGLTNTQVAKDTATAARLLRGRRVDAWYTLDQRAAYVFKSESFDSSALVYGEPQKTNSNWLASNLDFDADVAEALANALAGMREDGTYDAILSKYLD